MGLRIKKQGNGYREWWYATYRDGSRQREIRLSTPIEGTPPGSLKVTDRGDKAFEKSRNKAQVEFDKFCEERKSRCGSEALMQKLIASKIGTEPVYHTLEQLPELWNELPRDQALPQGRRRINENIFKAFTESCGRRFLYEVTSSDVLSYYTRIRKEYSGETVRTHISLLRGAFARFLPIGHPNPFKSIMKRHGAKGSETINKRPLTTEELQRIRTEACHDAFLLPLVECAINTGARIGDICQMKWENVNLTEGYISYRSSKTHILCTVPLFDEFRIILEGLLPNRDPNTPYLFPEAASMYQHNRSGITYRGKILFAKALFGHTRNESAPTFVGENGEPIPNKTPQEVLALIEEQGYTPHKAQCMKEVYGAYAVQGLSYATIRRKLGIAKPSISGYLHELERLPGVGNIVRFDSKAPSIDALIAKTRKNREVGKCSASLYSWHTFRTTFCVLASLAGIPEKEIINAVGHSTHRTMMKYYNHPTIENMKELWRKKLIGSTFGSISGPSARTAAAALLNKLSPELLQEVRRQLLTVPDSPILAIPG